MVNPAEMSSALHILIISSLKEFSLNYSFHWQLRENSTATQQWAKDQMVLVALCHIFLVVNVIK